MSATLFASRIHMTIVCIVATGSSLLLFPSTTQQAESLRRIIGLELGARRDLPKLALDDELLAETLKVGHYESEATKTESDKAKVSPVTRNLAGIQLAAVDRDVQIQLADLEIQRRQMRERTLASAGIQLEKQVEAETQIESQIEPNREQWIASFPERHRRRLKQLPQVASLMNTQSSGSNTADLESQWKLALAQNPMPSQFAQGNSFVVVGANSQPPKAPEPQVAQPPKTSAQPRPPSRPQTQLLAGIVEFAGGLAYSHPGQKLRVFQQDSGASDGQVNLADGSFAIDVDPTLSSPVVAELIDPDGHVVGLGTQSVATVLLDRKIRLDPLPQGFFGTLVSAYGTAGRPWPVKDAQLQIIGAASMTRTDSEGNFSFDEIGPNSRGLVLAKAKNHWNTLFHSATLQTSRERLFPTGMIEALIDLSGLTDVEKARSSSKGIVWLKLQVNGKPLAGAQLQVENQPKSRVIYLNNHQIADPQLRGTTDTGIVAVVNLDPGSHIIRVRAGETEFPPRWAEVSEGTVSYAELEFSKRVFTTLQVNELATGAPLPTTFKFWGSNREASTSKGVIKARVAPGGDPAVIKVDSGERYLAPIVTIERKTSVKKMNLPARDEFEARFDSAKISKEPGLGHVLILGLGQDSRVQIDQSNSQDSRGLWFRITTTQGHTEMALLLANISPGLRTIAIENPGQKRIRLETHMVLSDETSLVEMNEQ